MLSVDPKSAKIGYGRPSTVPSVSGWIFFDDSVLLTELTLVFAL